MIDVIKLKQELEKLSTGLDSELDSDAFLAGYLAGFKVSGEGYNAEWPFESKGTLPEDDDSWEAARLQAAINYIKSIWRLA